MMISLFIIALASGLLSWMVARSKQMDGMTWFFIGCLLPILSLLALIALPAKPPVEEGTGQQDDPQLRELLKRLESQEPH